MFLQCNEISLVPKAIVTEAKHALQNLNKWDKEAKANMDGSTPMSFTIDDLEAGVTAADTAWKSLKDFVGTLIKNARPWCGRGVTLKERMDAMGVVGMDSE